MVSANDVDDLFEDVRLASLYDLFNPWAECDDFYFERVTLAGGAAVDVGCGTGMLACRLAATGMDIAGVDPARGMLSVARSRPDGDRVRWIRAGAEHFRIDRRFRTAYMTGHAFQSLLDDATVVAALRAMAAHLEPHGVVVFETRNPLRRAWENWGMERGRQRARRDHPSLGPVVEVTRATYAARTGIARVRQEYRFESSGETLVGSCRVRFREHEHVLALVREAGLTVEACLGDWSGGPFTPASDEIIIVAAPRDPRGTPTMRGR